MKLKVIFGKKVPSSHIKPNIDSDNIYIEYAPLSHQVIFSNEFAPGWRGITNSNGSKGGWYMGCCFVRGLEMLTVEQLQKILKGVSEKIGDIVYGTTLHNMQIGIKNKMDKFINYIVSTSPIVLENVYWESHINSVNIQHMINTEIKMMTHSSSANMLPCT